MRDKMPYRYPAAIAGAIFLFFFLFLGPSLMKEDESVPEEFAPVPEEAPDSPALNGAPGAEDP